MPIVRDILAEALPFSPATPSPDKAKALATFFSPIQTAKANDLDTFASLLHVTGHIATADTDQALGALLPWRMT